MTDTPEYDVKDRLAQVNAKLAQEPHPEEQPKRQRSVIFSENVVSEEIPPEDTDYDEEEEEEEEEEAEQVDYTDENSEEIEKTTTENVPESENVSNVKNYTLLLCMWLQFLMCRSMNVKHNYRGR